MLVAKCHSCWSKKLPAQAATILVSNPQVDAASVTPVLESARTLLSQAVASGDSAAAGNPEAEAEIDTLFTAAQDLGKAESSARCNQ